MGEQPHHVTIKGTKDGLVFVLDDQCAFEDLLTELSDKLSGEALSSEGPQTTVNLKTGNRYLTEVQTQRIRDVILTEKNLKVEYIESDVISKAEAEDMARKAQVIKIKQMVRSGQSIDVTGDLLLVGDVHSGAFISATGEIYVMGALKGTAHAGSDGDAGAIVAASVMHPAQLRIGGHVSLGAEIIHTSAGMMEYAFVDGYQKIQLARIQSLYQQVPGSAT